MQPQRPDFYARIHKALRVALADFLIRLGATDAADRTAWAETAESWRSLDALLEGHSHHEDEHMHPLLGLAAPEIVRLLDGQHHALDAALASLRHDMAALDLLLDPAARRRAAQALYLAYSAFLADYLRHLIDEESRAMPALLAAYADDVLIAAHRRLLATMTPDESLGLLPLMARGLDPQELEALLRAVRHAPPPFYDRAMAIMRKTLSPTRLAALEAALASEPA